MKRLLLALALACAALVSPAIASAAGTLTISGPSTADFNQTVFLTGHTPSPTQDVTLHWRLTEHRTYTTSGPVTSGLSGAYKIQLPFPLSGDVAYYATAGGQRTPEHTVQVATVSCRASGPAFPKLPPGRNTFGGTGFAGFTATRGSVWAGTSIAGARFDVIRWSNADGLRVLGVFDYEHTAPWQATLPGSVDVVGITPAGSVVAAVEDPLGDGNQYDGIVWTKAGARHVLRASSTWDAVRPVGVADDGTIFGVASVLSRTGGRSYLVSWANADAPYRVLTSVGLAQTAAFVDASGDLVYELADGTAHVRLASGQVRQLQTSSGYAVQVAAAAGTYAWGVETDAGIERWDFSVVPVDGPITSAVTAYVPGTVDAANRYGDIVFDNGMEENQAFLPHHVLLGGDRYGDVPARDQRANRQAISYTGTVSYTSNADHLPHFLRC